MGIYAGLVWHFWFLCDDAFISFRFARNWARGNGLRYNLGAEMPVEGYTNFLWVAVCAVLERAGLDVTLWAPMLSAICGAVLLLRVWRTLALELRLDPLVAFLATLALACFPPFAVWSTSGLETMPFALCVYWGFEQLRVSRSARRDAVAILAAVAIALMRADGIFWALALAGCVWVGRAADRRGERRQILLFVGAALAAFGLYSVWRYRHFGDVIPNTARAKLGFSAQSVRRGVGYVASFWSVFITPALILLGGLFVAARGARREQTTALILLCSVPVLAAVLVGGDYMPMGRLLVAGFAFYALLAGVLLDQLRQRWSLRAPLMLGLAGLAIVIALLPGWDRHLLPGAVRSWFALGFKEAFADSEYGRWRIEFRTVEGGTRVGRALRRYAQPGDSLVSGAIGAVGYYSDLYIYDTCGLVSREVALRRYPEILTVPPGHDKCVPPSFFLDRRPTYLAAFVVPSADFTPPTEATKAKLVARILRNLEIDPDTTRILDEYELDDRPCPSPRRECSDVLVVLRHRQKKDAAGPASDPALGRAGLPG